MSALHAQDSVVQKTYRVPGHAALEVSTEDASVHASGCGACTTVQVKVDFHGTDPARYDLKESQTGNTVRLELKRKPVSNWLAGWPRGPEITIQVPADTNARLSTGSGSLWLREVHGQQELHTGSGSIHADEIDGSIQANTGSGDLHLVAVHGSLGAYTGSGAIDADGSVALHHVTTSSGSVHLTLRQGSTIESDAAVATHSGAVEIRMAPSTRAELRISTGSGGIHCDLPVTVQGNVERRSLHGTLNGGGPTLRVSTGSGSVSLRSL